MTTPEPPAGPDPWATGPPGPPPPWQPPGQPQPWPQQPAWPQQAGGPQQPGWPPGQWSGYPPAPRRPLRRWLPWVIVVAVLVLGGCGALVTSFGVQVFRHIDGAHSTADAFMTAAESGDTAAARALLCEDAPAETVPEGVLLGGQVLSHRTLGVNVQSSSGIGTEAPDVETANVTMELTLAGGRSQRELLVLRREHHAWRVCAVTPPLAR